MTPEELTALCTRLDTLEGPLKGQLGAHRVATRILSDRVTELRTAIQQMSEGIANMQKCLTKTVEDYERTLVIADSWAKTVEAALNPTQENT